MTLPGVSSHRRARRPGLSGFLVIGLAALGLWAAPLGAPPPDTAYEDARAPAAALPAAPAVPSEAAAGTDAAPDRLLHLQNELARALGTGAARRGQWGVMAVSASQRDTLFARNADASLAPASNQKLFTSAAALHHLGADFRYPTFLLARGEVSGGILHGDLVLYGTGDPSISDRLLSSGEDPFRSFAQELRDQGIERIRGDLLGDGTFFTGPTRRDSWNPDDLNDWFAAPISGLSFNENLVTLRIQPGSVGQTPRVLTQPRGALLDLQNVGRTVGGATRSPLMVVRDDPDDAIEIRGDIRTGQADVWRRMTVSDPPSFAASILRRVLEEEGIVVEGRTGSVSSPDESGITGRTLVAPGLQPDPAALWTVAVHHSPPLSELLGVVNKRSHNLYADALLFSLGRVTEGEGSFDGGSRALTEYLTRIVGIPEEGLHVVDGSGLSRLNRARPSAFIELLAHMDVDPRGTAFWASLPEAGNQRELRRMYRSPAAGNLRAKTGTIHRVSALSGVVRSSMGEAIYFSVMANDVPSPWAAKRVEDQIGIELASFSRPLWTDPSQDPDRDAPVPWTGTLNAQDQD